MLMSARNDDGAVVVAVVVDDAVAVDFLPDHVHVHGQSLGIDPGASMPAPPAPESEYVTASWNGKGAEM